MIINQRKLPAHKILGDVYQVPIYTLAKQMGTSVLMIEKYYSHLQVIQAIEQLRGTNTRKLIESGSKVSDDYQSKKLAKGKGAAGGGGLGYLIDIFNIGS